MSPQCSRHAAVHCVKYPVHIPPFHLTLVTSMLPLHQASRHRCFPICFKRELSLAYNLHKPKNPEPGHAPLIILHGLFGSKQNNRSISKYGFSRLDSQLRLLIKIGHLLETSKHQCMRLSVLDLGERRDTFANYDPGFKKSWRLTPRRSARLYSDGK